MSFSAVVSVIQAYSQPGALANTITSFLVSEKWTLESASSQAQVRLLDYLVTQEWSGVPLAFRKARFNNALKCAVRDGLVQVLQWWMDKYMPEEATGVVHTLFRLACQYDQVEVLRWLQETNRLSCLQSDFDGKSVKCYSLDLAHWLHQHACSTRLVLEVASSIEKAGNAEFLRWALAHQHLYEVNGIPGAVQAAAARGLLNDLIWVHQNTSVRCSRHILDAVVPYGHLHVVQWLCSFYPSMNLADPAMGCLDLKTVKWMLHDYKWKTKRARTTWIEASITDAAGFRAMNLIEYLYSIQPNANPMQAMGVAADCGDLEMIRYLHHKNVRTAVRLIENAVANDHLNVAIWLHENGYEGLSVAVVDKAAANGCLDILKWLHSIYLEGFTHRAIEMAAENGHIEVVEWLWNLSPVLRSPSMLKSAAMGGRLEIAQLIHANRYEYQTDHVIWNAASFGHLDMVKWLLENIQKPRDLELQLAVRSAARNGHMGIVQFLAPKVSVTKPFEIDPLGSPHGQFVILEWILKQRSEV